jgi:glycosyltransferase involved in cell wall biosynthesis
VRTLLVTGSLGRGGTELAVATLARELRRRGAYAPEIAVLGRAGELGDALRREGVPVHELAIDGPLRTPRRLLRLARLAALVRRGGRALLHTFLFDADVYGMLAALPGRPRAVITTRRAIKSKRPDHIRGYRATNWLVDRIVANSEAVRRFTLEREGVSPAKVVTIPNGVDAARFAAGDGAAFRARQGVAGDALLVGTVGNVRPVKGTAVLFEALVPLFARHPRLQFLVAGDATGPYAEELRGRVAARGLAGRVLLPGNVADVPGLLAALDVFVLPSLSEGMSNALLEAMAAGCAIVATCVGGNAECLADGAAGRLVPPDDAAALQAGVGALLAGDDVRRALGARARARVNDVYALSLMIERTEALYATVTGTR